MSITRFTAARRALVGSVALLCTLTLIGCAAASDASTGTQKPQQGESSAAPSQDPSASPSPTPKQTPEQTPAKPTKKQRAAATADLAAAVAQGDVDAARTAIEAGASLERRNAEGRTPLVVATKAQHTDMALMLLDAGADPNAKDDMEDSAFLYAGAEGFNKILRATLKHGAKVDDTNRYGGTALIPASEHAHVRTVEILIDAEVPLDHINELGWTALHEAIVGGDGSQNYVRTVRLLLRAGADPRIPDGNGTSPRDLAASAGQWDVVAEIDRALRS